MSPVLGDFCGFKIHEVWCYVVYSLGRLLLSFAIRELRWLDLVRNLIPTPTLGTLCTTSPLKVTNRSSTVGIVTDNNIEFGRSLVKEV